MSFSICIACTYVQYLPWIRRGLPRSSFKKEYLKYAISIMNKGLHTDHESLWIEPKLHETGITIYNSLSKSKVPFRTLNPGTVTWYNCGPTVYDSAHIGHALCYVQLDVIRRILQNIFHLNVVQVTGITDIDDKIVKRANELNTSVQSLTQRYEREFYDDMTRLNVLPSSIYARVTDHIPQIVSFVQRILENGFAYAVGDTVYFDTSQYCRYGKLVKISESEMTRQTIFDPNKRSPKDFVLWKGAKEWDTEVWNSPWGPGRPGWHIECSAIACQIFGEKLDLHTGGVDLMFPHHENEEAQCCAHHRADQWCNYWVHIGHLHVKGATKMSKSLKNTISVDEFLKKFSSNAFRIYCLLSNHRSPVEYTNEEMEIAEKNLNRIKSFLQDTEAYINGRSSSGPLSDAVIIQKLSDVQRSVRASLANDFNTRQVIFSLQDLVSVCNKEMNTSRKVVQVGRSVGTVVAVRNYIQELLSLLGITLHSQLPSDTESLPQVIDAALNFRKSVRDFALLRNVSTEDESLSKAERKRVTDERAPLLEACDTFRKDFHQAGFEIKDYSGGTGWSYNKDNKPVCRYQ